MIYFFRCYSTNLVKIGTTRRLSVRLKTLTREHGEGILLGVVDGGRKVEAELHERFRHLRVQGEWFNENGLLEFIALHTRAWDGEDDDTPLAMAKLRSDVLRDARIVVAFTGENLCEYLSRLLDPLVTRDKDREIQKDQKGS